MAQSTTSTSLLLLVCSVRAAFIYPSDGVISSNHCDPRVGEDEKGEGEHVDVLLAEVVALQVMLEVGLENAGKITICKSAFYQRSLILC